MRIEELLERLKGVRENGPGSWMACCPAHDDRNPSMSVTERDRKILMHCHAGCSVDDICAALGIEKKDLFEDDLARGGGRVRRPKGDAAGLPCDPVSLPATAGAQTKKSGGREKLLIPFSAPYHLPQLIQAGKAGRAIVIVEGEKDVETVESLGIVATCNPFGSGKWGKDWPADWGKWFDGVKSIFIVADKDPETFTRTLRGKAVTKPFLVGQKHAWDVRRQLAAAGVKAMVRLVCMPDVNGRPVKDFTDWVMARQAEGLPCDKKAFLGAVAEFGEWPDAWCFTDEQVAEGAAAVSASARAEKNGARAAASSDSSFGGDQSE